MTDTSKSSRNSSLDDDSLNSLDNDPPSVSQIFIDAELYERLLVSEGCRKFHCAETDCSDGFANLVGRDLKPSEQATTGRLAKLSVTGDHWTAGELTAEPESIVEDIRSDSDSQTTSSQSSDSTQWKPSPEELIQIFVDEFGPLATETEQEEIIFETDAALFVDVAIVGVVHLTTHRLTFHASLLATRPDLLPSQQIIKAGPAIIHRKGLRMKRRIWLELSHDMICSYSSGSEDDRIRPFRTILLSSIKKVQPIDPKHPRFLTIVFDNEFDDTEAILEFTTEESASDWARELQGALFLYRHLRRQVLRGNDMDQSTGIRLSVPLTCIQDVQIKNTYFNTSIAFLQVRLPQTDTCGFSMHETRKGEAQIVRLCQLVSTVQWSRLGEYVAAAKARKQGAGSEAETSHLVVDCGPLTYSEKEGFKTADSDTQSNTERTVRRALALGDESELWIVKARNRNGICAAGRFVVTPNVVGFWSKLLTQSDIRYRIPTSSLKLASPSKSILFSSRGIVLEIEGQSDLKFEFKTLELRDEAIRRINSACQVDNTSLSSSERPPTTATSFSYQPESPKHLLSPTEIISPTSRAVAAVISRGLPVALTSKLPKAVNLPRNILFKGPSLHFVCLTIGSRGDVQPYIALGLGLRKEGHRVTIVTHDEYKEWITGFGIEHRPAGGDPGALMKLSVDNKMFSPDFFRESFANFRSWLDDLLEDAWIGCQGADVLLESPSAMAGVHIAEALKIPYFRTFTMPWTKTTEFPHTFLSPPVEAPTFNSLSYVLFDNVFWTATSGQVNRWRRQTLKIDSTDMGHRMQSKITFIYNFSQAVVPKPLDWGDFIVLSGYWFLDNPDLGWTPPPSLLEWMKKARNDRKPIVYIGFGSITVPNPSRLTRRIVKAVVKSDVRAIICKGWSGRMSKDPEPDVEIPPQCYPLDKVPHDWLFPQIDAAFHHGGAGTTGASLRAGIPTLIKPWFGDQYFWASRIQKLGAGLKVPSLRVNDLAEALTQVTSSRIMKEKAASIGEKIRAEDGVHTAIKTIYTYLPRASKDRATLD